jgi:hypothetical protein
MLAPIWLYVGRRVDADPLLKDTNFRRFWLSGALNNFSAQISGLALPLCAALLLGASPAQMGILLAVQFLPFALFGLLAGVWLDRHHKRPALLACKLMSLLALLSVPIAWWCELLSMPWLYAVSFTLGFSFLVGGSAEQILLTGIVGRDGLLAAHARFSNTDAVARLVGPGIAGTLVQALSAPLALLVTAAGLSLSVTVMRTIRFADNRPVPGRRTPFTEMCLGLQFIWRNPLLRALSWSLALWNLMFIGYAALNVLFATRILGLSAGTLGIAEAAGSIGILAGALGAARLARRYGAGMTILAGFGATTASFLLMAILPARLGGSAGATLLAYAVLLVLRDAGVMLIMLPYTALRQRITPDRFMGRVITTMRFLTVALTPIGALAAGLCGEMLGVRATLVGIGGASLCMLLVLARSSPMAGAR